MADNSAFDAMNIGAGDDMFISGGAITVSEYEQNMTPDDQSRYEKTLLNTFQSFYAGDPDKGRLDFSHWLKTLNPELVRERAKEWEDVRAENQGVHKFRDMDPIKVRLIENSGTLQRLSHLHTGRVEDLIDLVLPVADSAKVGGGNLPDPEFRR
jgi:hypothetical protein